MRRLAAAIDTNDMESSSDRGQQQQQQQQQQHSAVYRCNGVFLAFFQTTHIWGNLVSSLFLSHDFTIQHAGAGKAGSMLFVEEYEEMYSAADSTGAYCGTYDTCNSLRPVTSLTAVNTSGTCGFLANVNSRSRSLYAIAHPSSVCRLSVCNVRAPYSGG